MAELFGQDCAADGTSLIIETVCLSTGLVAECVGLAVDVGVIATRASVGGVAFLSTSRIGNYCLVIVAEFFGQDYAANGTSLIVETIRLCAWLMTKCIGNVVGVGIVATATSMSGISFLSTSRISDY